MGTHLPPWATCTGVPHGKELLLAILNTHYVEKYCDFILEVPCCCCCRPVSTLLNKAQIKYNLIKDLEQLSLVKSVPAHGEEVGTDDL